MDTKVKGIIIKLTEFKEADKLATVFTYEHGLISAKFSGVKKDKAKFKSVAQPFCFADFILNKTASSNTIISADIIDNFFGLTANYQKTMCGYVVLDLIKTILPKEKPEQEIFLLTISALKDIETKNEYIALIDYLIKFCYFSGMQLELDCTGKIYLDKETGNFTSNKNAYAVEIDKKVFTCIKNIADGIKQDVNLTTLKQATKLFASIIFAKFGSTVKCFEYI